MFILGLQILLLLPKYVIKLYGTKTELNFQTIPTSLKCHNVLLLQYFKQYIARLSAMFVSSIKLKSEGELFLPSVVHGLRDGGVRILELGVLAHESDCDLLQKNVTSSS